MSLKAVELQVALPRTQEIGRIQEQQQQKLTHEQQQIISERKQIDQQMRQRATDVDQTAKSKIREKEDQQNKNKKRGMSATVDPNDETATPHDAKHSERSDMRDPLRGRHIDISL